ncbi:MAG: S53 family peptidase [Firmicutes bacterium]|nr:S53 family peptidase [Bacillota bacterium]
MPLNKTIRRAAAALAALALTLGVSGFSSTGHGPAGTATHPIHVRPNASTSPQGLSPAQVRHAYGIDKLPNDGAGVTIAIVDAYDHPKIENDLAVFDQTFGLPAPPSFVKHKMASKIRTDGGWALEIALDVEWAHALAPKANILLVEASSSSLADLLAAVDWAVNNGANVVSMSWGGGEFSSEPSYDGHFQSPGIVFLASSGDSGTGASWPASSPYVVAVGGTTLNVDAQGNYISETAWSGSGGGTSAYEAEPDYQTGFQSTGKRGIPDVAFDADPNTGVSVYDSVRYQGQSGWWVVGGTSLSAPAWAGIVALADQARGTPLTDAHQALYNLATGGAYASNYHDITSGTNGSCGSLCTATTGYDFVTGVGSPKADQLVPALASQP